MIEGLQRITARATQHDQTGVWPAEDLADLARAGAMRWAVPAEFGGVHLPPIEIHKRYEEVASASLATALILTQRDSAIGLIEGGINDALKAELLPELATNSVFATVGIAQLTTSRQRGAPAMQAQRRADSWIISGHVPWSTGANQAQHVVAGALVDGPTRQQVLFVLPMKCSGIQISPPMNLVALRSTHTCSIRCDEMELDPRWIIAGPVDNALANRRRTLPIGQAFLALGLVRGAIELIESHDSDRARMLSSRFEPQLAELRQRVHEHCGAGAAPDPATSARLRGECNELAIRATHAAVALYKGTALLSDHPAQRLAREAMFLLVWSCPDPVIDCTVDLLSQR